mgnify:CR=1 FL=1
MQAFFEANTAFMPTPDLLNHRVHMNSVIAKFPIGERSTDYAYLTKSSIDWRLVLVELEDSSKPIFKESSKNEAFSTAFNDAVAQIDVWRDYVSQYPLRRDTTSRRRSCARTAAAIACNRQKGCRRSCLRT